MPEGAGDDAEAGVANRTMGRGEWGLLVGLAVLWGGSFFFVELAVAELPPLTVVLGRVGLGALVLLVVLRARGERMPRGVRVWAAFALLGLLNNLIPFSLIFWAQTQIESGLAAILNAATPFSAVILAHLLTADDRMTPNRVAGVLVGIGGVAFMVGPAALGGLGASVLAQGAVLLGGVCYTLGSIFARRFGAAGVSPLATAAGQVTASAVLAFPFVFLLDRPWALASPSLVAVVAVVALALLSTALAYVIFFRLLASAGVTNLSLVTLLVPVTAILLGTLVLGERLEPRHFLGMVTIAAGLGLIDGRPLGWLRRRAGTGRPRA
jgi:drug/metabolite transporter (DMT)-like permease